MTRQITVTATGDALITTRMPDHQDAPYRQMIDLIQSVDVAFTNMEMVLSDYQGSPVVEAGGGNLSAEPAVAEDLMQMGFNLTAFANNHTLNYGEYGCLKTLEVLKELGFTCAGAGRNLAEARWPVFLDNDAGRIGLVGCASSFATGQRAGDEAYGLPGRPGLNPQRFDTLFVVDEEHMQAIQNIAELTGAEEKRQHGIWSGFRQPPKREGEFQFAERSFIVGDEFGIRTEANQKDLDANMTSIRQAAETSDLTLVSIHAHEEGIERWLPADFIIEFAHAAVENGADMVIGHGPHLLRGLELYQDKPIFYSVGNFIFQPELMRAFPVDDYDAFDVDPSLPVTELFKQVFKNGERGFPADHLYWESVLPICTFEDRRLAAIALHPITLGHGKALPERGTPRLANLELGGEILDWMTELSEPFGTTIDVRDGVGYVNVSD